MSRRLLNSPAATRLITQPRYFFSPFQRKKNLRAVRGKTDLKNTSSTHFSDFSIVHQYNTHSHSQTPHSFDSTVHTQKKKHEEKSIPFGEYKCCASCVYGPDNGKFIYILYLRPFFSTKRKRKKNAHRKNDLNSEMREKKS